MEIYERGKVPLYEVKCHECKSIIRYKASDVSWLHITCPVCGISVEALTIHPVEYEAEPPEEEK